MAHDSMTDVDWLAVDRLIAEIPSMGLIEDDGSDELPFDAAGSEELTPRRRS